MRPAIPLPIPYGWYQVAYSEDLPVGTVKPLEFFGRNLAAFRTTDGEARVFDAYCPHMGAHLGYGGTVVENTVRCPFHAWRFDGSGRCVEVPYAKRIPPQARMKTYPTLERNGMVMAWYHPLDLAPDWDVPEVPEIGSPEWTTPVRREWIVRSHSQELAENTVDQAHFRYVHGTHTIASTEVETKGHRLSVVSRSKVGTGKGEADGTIEIDTYGFGLGVTRFTGIVETLVITTGSPIDGERMHMHLCFTVRKTGDERFTEGVGKMFVAEIERQFGQDIPIWENKIHLERPVLCDGDGPIGELRRWAKQFYVGAPPSE